MFPIKLLWYKISKELRNKLDSLLEEFDLNKVLICNLLIKLFIDDFFKAF